MVREPTNLEPLCRFFVALCVSSSGVCEFLRFLCTEHETDRAIFENPHKELEILCGYFTIAHTMGVSPHRELVNECSAEADPHNEKDKPHAREAKAHRSTVPLCGNSPV
jgi:hypothetical protein